MDLLGLGALGVVGAEWLALGWLSGVNWPAARGTWWVARWALRLVVGAALLAFTSLVLAFTPAGFGNTPLVLALTAGLALALRLLVVRPAHDEHKPVPIDRREWIGWLVLGAVLLGATVRSLLVPEAGWDAYSHWGLRAQADALAGTVVSAHSEHEYYPPLVPLLEAWFSLQRGLGSIDQTKTIWALIGSAFGLCLGWHLRLALRQTWAAPYLAVGIVLATPALLEGFWTGQADLALTAYLTLATLAVWQWLRAPHRLWLVQAAIFGAAATLAKLEGGPRVSVIIAVLALTAVAARGLHPLVPALWLALTSFLGVLLWTAVASSAGISANTEHLGAFQPLALGSVLLSLAAVFGGIRTGGALLVITLTFALSGRALLREPLRFLTLVVLAQLAVTLLAFLVSSTAPDVEVRTSATRLFEQWLPLALFLGAVGLDCLFGAIPDPRSASPESSGISTYNRRGR